MVITGKVLLIDYRFQGAILRDSKGVQYTFNRKRCANGQWPKVGSYVTFEIECDDPISHLINMAKNVATSEHVRSFRNLPLITAGIYDKRNNKPAA